MNLLPSILASSSPALRAAFSLSRSGFVSSQRAFSAAAQKLNKKVTEELQFEKDNYEKPADLAKLPKDWKFTDAAGDVNLKLEKELGRRCRRGREVAVSLEREWFGWSCSLEVRDRRAGALL